MSNLKIKEGMITKSKLCDVKNWWKFWGSIIRSWNWIELNRIESHVNHLVYFCVWMGLSWSLWNPNVEIGGGSPLGGHMMVEDGDPNEKTTLPDVVVQRRPAFFHSHSHSFGVHKLRGMRSISTLHKELPPDLSTIAMCLHVLWSWNNLDFSFQHHIPFIVHLISI